VSTGADCAEAPGAIGTRSKSTISSLRADRADKSLPDFRSSARNSGETVDEEIAGVASARSNKRLVL
jgi:hypothetical protein